MHAQTSSSRHTQHGLAALEFSILALFIMVPLFLGTFVYWEVLQTQQVVTRATGDSARQVMLLMQIPRTRKPDGTVITEAEVLTNASSQVQQSIASALRAQVGDNDVNSNRVTVSITRYGNTHWLLDVAYRREPLLGNPGGMNLLEPKTLHARSFIQIP